MNRLPCILVLLALAHAAPAEDKPKEKPQSPTLEGLWKMTGGTDRGQALTTVFDIHWTIDAKNNVLSHFGPKPDDQAEKFSLVVDPQKKTADRKRGDQVTLGLYELEGDNLVVCFNFVGKDRPTRIESNSTYTVYRFRRVKPPGGKDK